MKDYCIGTCPFRQGNVDAYCSALRQAFKEESFTFLRQVHEFHNFDYAVCFSFSPFCALPWSNTVILFRQWLKISLFMILLQCPGDDRVFAAPVRLPPEEEGILGFFVGAKKPTERGEHGQDR